MDTECGRLGGSGGTVSKVLEGFGGHFA